jgi:hypothetical protein
MYRELNCRAFAPSQEVQKGARINLAGADAPLPQEVQLGSRITRVQQNKGFAFQPGNSRGVSSHKRLRKNHEFSKYKKMRALFFSWGFSDDLSDDL